MPSGSRKRKAAKKKKENQSYDMLSTASAQPPSSDDVKIQDDKVTALEEDNAMPHNPSVEEPQLEVGEDSNLNPTHKEDVSSERDEEETRCHDGDSSSESTNDSIISINSDDESAHGIKTGTYETIDTAQLVDSFKAVDSLPEKDDVTTSVFEDVTDSMVGDISAQEKDLAFEYKEEVHISSSDDSLDETSVITENETVGHGEKQPRILEDNIGTTADVIEENDARMAQLCDEHVVITENIADLDEELEVPESFAPNNFAQPAQTTSLKSCCGLFEVFTGYGG